MLLKEIVCERCYKNGGRILPFSSDENDLPPDSVWKWDKDGMFICVGSEKFQRPTDPPPDCCPYILEHVI